MYFTNILLLCYLTLLFCLYSKSPRAVLDFDDDDLPTDEEIEAYMGDNKRKREDDEDVKIELRPMRKRFANAEFSSMEYPDFCEKYASRLQQGGRIASLAYDELIGRHVEPEEKLDMDIIDTNIQRMLRRFHNWVVERRGPTLLMIKQK